MKPSRLYPFLAVLALAIAAPVVHADSNVPKSYPLATCPVSGDKLGEHGKSVRAVAPDGTVVYLCCKDCMKDFKKDPAKYAKQVKDAEGKKKG